MACPCQRRESGSGRPSRGRTLFERRVEHRRDGVPERRLAAMDLPPGPRAPAAWQTVAWTMRPAAFLRDVHDRFGDPVTIRTYWTDEAMVLFSSPDAVREVFLLDPAIAPAGQSWEFLRPFAGPHSILVLDGEEHLRERRLIDVVGRLRAQPGGDSVLGLLLEQRDEDGNPPTDRHLRDQLVALLVAGHDTSAASLAWAFERLARHPAVHARLRDGDPAYLD